MSNYLSASQIEIAFDKAKDELHNQEYLWIHDSSRTKRAYLIGIFNTLKHLGNTTPLSGKLLIELSKTMFLESDESK